MVEVGCGNMESVEEPLAAVLARLGSELSRLASEASRLEETVGDLPWDRLAGDTAGRDAVTVVQSLDHLRQSLEGLADFVQGVGSMTAEDWQVRTAMATAGLTLTGLVLHLSGDGQADAGGDLELFADG